MARWMFALVWGMFVGLASAREPFKPRDRSIPFAVYYLSRYRGVCVGTLVSRSTVITACVCVVDPTADTHDVRPINVVAATMYRHPRRGIRVQVTKLIIPKLSNVTAERAYMVQKSPAFMLLAKKIPDALAEVPLRPITVEFKGDESLALHEECLMNGWHFFYKGARKRGNEIRPPFIYFISLKDKIYPAHKFLLQRNIRVQYLTIAKKSLWCNTITLKFQKAMTNLGYTGLFDKTSSVCVKDPDRDAQPCHGMYGAPFICRGKAFGMLMSPDAQWANCTGHTSIVHLFSAMHIRNLMTCASPLFLPEYNLSWEAMKKSLENEDYNHGKYDYLPELYDRMVYQESESSEET